MILVDSHCHLNMLENYDKLITQANESGVKYIQTICTKLEDIERILSITEKYKNIFASVGVHPSEVKKLTTASELIELANHTKIIGLGETGLDYHYNEEELQKNLQRKVFEEHIIASCKTNLPIIVHTRDAENHTYDIISSYKKSHDFNGLIHCFTASEDFARKILDLGFYISIAGIITFKNAEDLRTIVKFVPLDRILIETDSPYLAPVPNRGKTNEPAFVVYVAEAIAKLKNISLDECAIQTTKNFFSLFTKAKK